MSRNDRDKDGRAVPSRRLSRLAGLGGMAANIAGGIAAKGVQQLATGKRPKVSDLLMTPSNARKLTHQLSNMRGAAMKIGQMISMDSGDFLPKDFADILARLRADAQHMPRTQLNQVLKSEWPEAWQMKFATFDYRPIAAASIGQVHKAVLQSGETLAIKVQYPGVKESIDSDVKNVAGLLKISDLVPSTLDVKPIIEEGRKQLHQEADYIREAEYLCRFGKLLSANKNFEVPSYFPELSTDKILAMSFSESVPIEDMMSAPQETRDHIVYLLIELTLRELFEFQLMQTDPNFANYRYNPQSQKIVLLDFGASRDIHNDLAAAYKHLMQNVLGGDKNDILEAAIQMGLLPAQMKADDKAAIIDIVDMAMEPLRHDAVFDFGQNDVAVRLRDKGMDLAGKRELWHVPPPETIFIQRKFGGIYMLATRLRARVNVHALMQDLVNS